MNADHKKHKNRVTLRQWTPEEHLVSVPIESCVGFQSITAKQRVS